MTKIKCLFLLLCLLPLCACSNEIENYAIVSGAAIDLSQEGLSLTVEVADVSSGSPEGAGQSITFTAQGKDIASAQKALERHMGKQLYWEHTSLIILSQELCERGLSDVVTWIMSSHSVRISVPLLVSKEGAEKLLSSTLAPYKTTSFGLRSMLDNNADRGIGIALPVYQLYNRLQSPSACALLPYLTVEHDSPVLTGSAIIKDYHYIGTLSPEQTQIYSLLAEQVDEALLDLGDVTMRTVLTSTSLSAKDETCRFSFRVQGILEQGELSSHEDPASLLSSQLQSQAQALYRISASLNADFLGLNNARYRAQAKNFTKKAVGEIPVTFIPDVYIYDYGQAT